MEMVHQSFKNNTDSRQAITLQARQYRKPLMRFTLLTGFRHAKPFKTGAGFIFQLELKRRNDEGLN